MTQIQLSDDKEQWIEELTGEFLLFGLLGKLLYENPEQSLLTQLVDDDVFADAPFAASQDSVQEGLVLLQQWAQAFRADAAGTTLDLKADYTRLFVGTIQLPLSPWESVYYNEERLLFQESTTDVRRWYRRFGLQAINLRKEPDDHIGLELAFMAHLAQHALVELSFDDQSAFHEVLERQREFSQRHLLLWTPLWCTQMVEYAQTPFYRGLALLLRGALDELAQLLGIPLPEVPVV